MIRPVSLSLVILATAAAVQAQPAKPVCAALDVRIAQSPAHLEGRILNEALFEAAALNCPEIASRLLEMGASVEARNRFGGTPLNVAAARGAREIVASLLDHGAVLDHANLGGTTPLLAAVQASRRRMVTDLIAAGANVNVANREGITPVMAAAFEGDSRMLGALLEAGGDPDVQDRHGKGALVYAAGRAFPAIVGQLLAAGADADQVWGFDLTALMWAAGHANDAPAADGIEVARQLLDAGALLYRQDDRGRTALMIAAERGHLMMVDYLLQAGANPGLQDKTGARAADLAANDQIRALLQP
ncbi:ankyrin repeat domain-containing protein [Fluviibacterium sp. DFM31]|uniref:Ankyrin repeat domain-containing protein n=1 Tax=Meridianimarinicoccus marinus TaxID=3231483 RepID=A0ABV3L937_9RHOB